MRPAGGPNRGAALVSSMCPPSSSGVRRFIRVTRNQSATGPPAATIRPAIASARLRHARHPAMSAGRHCGGGILPKTTGGLARRATGPSASISSIAPSASPEAARHLPSPAAFRAVESVRQKSPQYRTIRCGTRMSRPVSCYSRGVARSRPRASRRRIASASSKYSPKYASFSASQTSSRRALPGS